MNTLCRTAKLFIRELGWGLRRGAQHRYLVLGLGLGLVLLLLLAIGRSVLHVQVYETILGRAGGPRVWMDSAKGLTPDNLKKGQDRLRLADGRPLAIYPYSDITAKSLALPGEQGTRNGLHGRLITPDHPLGRVLQPVAGDRRSVMDLGFLSGLEAIPRPDAPSEGASILHESPQAVIYLALNALPAIDWRAQGEKAPDLLKPDYRMLQALAADCRIATLLQTPAGVAHLYGEADTPPEVKQVCGEARRDYRRAFSDWREQLIAGGNRRSGLFLANGDWVRIVWVREIPLPGRFDYLMDFRLGQALKLRAGQSGGDFGACRTNLGSRYDDLSFFVGAESITPEALYLCLAPCFAQDHPGCRLEEATPYGAQRLIGAGLYPAWLRACPALKGRWEQLSPGNQTPTMDRACVGSRVFQADIYLPEYGALPEAERLLKERWGMGTGDEAREALARVAELEVTLDALEWNGSLALLAYLLVVLLALHDNLARHRQGTLGQLRAHGLRSRYILWGGMVADLLSWLLSAGFAGIIALGITWLLLDTSEVWEHYRAGMQEIAPWLAGSLALHLSAGALIHWWRVLSVEPGKNLSGSE